MRPGVSHVARPGMLAPLCKNMYQEQWRVPTQHWRASCEEMRQNLREVFFITLVGTAVRRTAGARRAGCCGADALASVRAMLARDEDPEQEVGATRNN